MNSLLVDVPGRKAGKCEGTSRGLGTNHVKPREARALSTRDGNMKLNLTNMAGNEVEDRDVASLEGKVVSEGAVVELIRRRYSQNKIYVRNILAARAGFLSKSC